MAQELDEWRRPGRAAGIAVASRGVPQFPSLKARELRRVLEREPLGYSVERQQGSHATLKSARYPELHLAFHDGQTLAPGLVKKILVKDVGITEDAALALIGG